MPMWNHSKRKGILFTDFYRENVENSMSTGDEGSGTFQLALMKGTDREVAML